MPGKAGADITATMTNYPAEKADGCRLVDGKREPVYRVSVGDTLHIAIRLTNSGTCFYWAYDGEFITLDADVFETPGISTYVSGIGDGVWGSNIGVPSWDPDPSSGDHHMIPALPVVACKISGIGVSMWAGGW